MFSSPREVAKGEAASAASSPGTSSTAGDKDAPGTSASDAIRRNLAEMESSFYDSPTARKAAAQSASLPETPAAAITNDAAFNGRSSESRFSGLGVTPIAARTQTLALKEQENIVDKYQKENFSLKMKLYYLEKRLTQLSDEEVKRMIAENIELSTYKISAAKEIKALNKRIRELQFEVNDRDARLETQEKASQRENNLAAERDGARYDTEQELSFMRDRITTYEVEISQLRDQVNGTVHDGSSDTPGRLRSGSGSVISLRRHESEMESLELVNGHLRDTMSELKMENQELTRQVETLNEDLAKYYDQANANADDSILERSASRAHARGESGSSGRGFESHEAEIESLEIANGQLRDAQSILRMQNIELTGQLDLFTEELGRFQGLENDFAKLQHSYHELREEVERLQGIEDQLSEMQNAKTDLEGEFEGLRKEKQSAIEWAKILTERIETLTAELTDFADLKQQFEELQLTHEELQDHLEGTVRTLKENEQTQLEKIRHTATEKMDNLEDMISRKEAELAVLRSENAGLNQHEGEMYSRMDELVEEVEASKKEIENLKAESQRLSELLEKEKTVRRAQNATHEQMLKQQPQTQESNMISARNSRITELEAGRQADKRKQEALERQFKARLQELEKRLVSEREGRLVDRKGARARLLEGERENNDLKEKLRKLQEKF